MFQSMLIPLDGSVAAARAVRCAAWLAAHAGARLHVLTATTGGLPARAELARLQVPEEYWSRIELHQTEEDPESSILAAVSQHRIDLVVMSAQGIGGTKSFGHVARAVLEQVTVPVLLVPPNYREALPWQRVLVPVSGGPESDCAVTQAVALADLLELTVHLAHVTDDAAGAEGLAVRTRYSDALHHEYRSQLDELMHRAIAPEQRGRVQRVALGRGDVVAELVALIREEQISVLVVGWHGQLDVGHAHVLKGLLPLIETPVLLVKSSPPPAFRLEVGEALE